MNATITYSLWNKRFAWLSFVVVLLLYSVVLCSLGFLKLVSDFGSNLKISIAGVLYMLLLSYLAWFTLQILYLYGSYVRHQRNILVQVNTDEKYIRIAKKQSKENINYKNLDRIEFYVSSRDDKSLVRNFEYTKLITKDNKVFIIASLVVDFSLIERVFDRVPQTIKVRDIVFLEPEERT